MPSGNIMSTPFGNIRQVQGEDEKTMYYDAEDICGILGLDNEELKRLVAAGAKISVIYDADLNALLLTKKDILSIIRQAQDKCDDKDRYHQLCNFRVFVTNHF